MNDIQTLTVYRDREVYTKRVVESKKATTQEPICTGYS